MIDSSRLSKSMQLVLITVFPPKTTGKAQKVQLLQTKLCNKYNYITVYPKNLHAFFSANVDTFDAKQATTIFIPEVLPLTAPFLLFYLKRNGFSGCRAEVAHGGLIVHAAR
jgi:hypothetical protein